jgi:uncharacterized membrane protein YfhO
VKTFREKGGCISMTLKDVDTKGLRGFIKLHPDKLDWIAVVVIVSSVLGLICYYNHISFLDIVMAVLVLFLVVYDWITSTFVRRRNISLKAMVVIGLIILIGLLIEMNRKLR